MVVGILAVLKAGACYVPQDVGVTPTVQLRHIAKVASIGVVLTVSWLKHLVPLVEGQT